MTAKIWRRFTSNELSQLQRREARDTLGVIHNHHKVFSRARAEFEFVRSRYDKLLSRCPLHKSLEKSGRATQNPMGIFLKLDSRRDSLGRAQRIEWADLRRPVYRSRVFSSLGYLRLFYLKKLMVQSLAGVSLNTKDDFKYSIMRTVFDVSGTTGEQSEQPKEETMLAEGNNNNNRFEEEDGDNEKKGDDSSPTIPCTGEENVVDLQSNPPFLTVLS